MRTLKDGNQKRFHGLCALAACALAIAGLPGCEDETHIYAGRCAANGGGYSINVGTGAGASFEGTWGECWYGPTFDDENAVLTLFDSRVTPVRDEEANTFSWNQPAGFRGIAYIRVGMAPVKEPGSIPVRSYPYDDWNEFFDATLDGEIAMAEVSFYDDQGWYYLQPSGNGGVIAVDEVDWPGPDETGGVAFHSTEDLVFPTAYYTATVALEADLTLATVPSEQESGSMLSGIAAPSASAVAP